MKNKKFLVGGLLRSAAIILVVVAAGLLAVNQGLGYYYKAEFLKSPCQLCGELNPDVKICIEELNSPRPSYWIEGDSWSDPFNKTNINITIDYLTP